MTVLTFDTLKLSQKLESSGFTHEQAVGAAEALADTFTDSVATKSDLKELRSDLINEIKHSELRIIKWLVPLFLGQAALVAALVKLF